MSNVVIYVMTNWQNLPDKSTPINQTNLRHIEQGVKNVTDFINTLDATSGLYLCQTPFTTVLKSKLDGIEAGANKYTLPTASQSVLGGVKVDGVTVTISNGVISAAAATIPNLSQLSDVNISSLSNGQVLKWDAANSKWVNANESGGTSIDELNDINDVDITDPSDGQGLIYDADNDKWINGNVASAMASLTDVVLTSLSDGQTLIWDSATSKWVNSDVEIPDVLDYDETLNVLGDASQVIPSIPIVYSFDEQVIGKWVDGKPLYQKSINFGTLPNSDVKSVAHNIANVDHIWVHDGIFEKTGGFTNFIAGVSPTDVTLQWWTGVTKTEVQVRTGIDRTDYTYVIVTLRYTKTTDQIPNT